MFVSKCAFSGSVTPDNGGGVCLTLERCLVAQTLYVFCLKCMGYYEHAIYVRDYTSRLVFSYGVGKKVKKNPVKILTDM